MWCIVFIHNIRSSTGSLLPCLFSLNDFYEIKNCIDNDHLSNVSFAISEKRECFAELALMQILVFYEADFRFPLVS